LNALTGRDEFRAARPPAVRGTAADDIDTIHPGVVTCVSIGMPSSLSLSLSPSDDDDDDDADAM